MNNAIGIPSGWEEIAAYWYFRFFGLTSGFIIERIIAWNNIGIESEAYAEDKHDWRVEE